MAATKNKSRVRNVTKVKVAKKIAAVSKTQAGATKKTAASKTRAGAKKSTAKIRAKNAPRKIQAQTPENNTPPPALKQISSPRQVSSDTPQTPHVAVVLQSEEDKLGLLDELLQSSSFWLALQEKHFRSGLDKHDFKILIKPDLNACELTGSTATDPELVEQLIDLLHDRGFTQVVVGDSRNSFDSWLENRDVQILADILGYRYVTSKDRGYDVIDFAEDLAPGPFAEGSILHNSHLPRAWLEADFHILFSKNKTDDETAYYLGLNNLISLLPLKDKDYHYKHRLNRADVLIELLHHIDIDFCIIDAFISNHGNAGTRVARPLQTNTLIAGENLLLTDYVAAEKMGTELNASPIHNKALREFGLPKPYRIDGDMTPYPAWIKVNPLLLNSNIERAAWVELDQLLQPWLQIVDEESFPLKDPVNAKINGWVSQYLQGVDDNPNVFWSLVVFNYILSFIYQSVESLRVMHWKDKILHKEMPLNISIDAYPTESYEAIVDYLEPLAEKTRQLKPDSNGLRWVFHNDGSVLFEFSRIIPVDYEDFVSRVDITKSIQYMNDYIGGLIVPVNRNTTGQVTHQVERNVYLPQPNYLILFQGQDIDVSKLEFILYGESEQKMLWQTVKSENGSATYDDGIVSFKKTEQGDTLVSIFGRQHFTLPPFWQIVDLDNFPILKERLFDHAYTTFFTNTMANFEAVYEGREVRVGKQWIKLYGEEGELHQQSPSEKMASLLTRVSEFIEDKIPDKAGLISSLLMAYNPQPEYVDEDGFAHFKSIPESQADHRVIDMDQAEGLQTLFTSGNTMAQGFWKDLYEAMLKDNGIRYG